MVMSKTQTRALATAAERRGQLKNAIARLERAIATPAAMPSWRDHVRAEVGQLRIALDDHVEEVEAETGLLAELLEQAPRLANRIERVRQEHSTLVEMVARIVVLFDADEDPEVLRESIVEALVAIVRHRQRGADLVYEGYNVDIGGG